MDESSPARVFEPDGSYEVRGPLDLKDANGLPDYIPLDKIIKAIVTKIDDAQGLTYVRFAENKGIIDLETMKWARKPDPNLRSEMNCASQKTVGCAKCRRRYSSESRRQTVPFRTFASAAAQKRKAIPYWSLRTKPPIKIWRCITRQQPIVEAGLLAIDQKSTEVISMVGGYDFAKSQFNRVLQAARQTGSSFKAIVYTAALDKTYTPNADHRCTDRL